MAARRFKIVTLGCKVNQYESAYLKSKFLEAGWIQSKGRESNDIILVNTCLVTRTAGHQSRQAVRKAIREDPKGLVGAIGCYPQAFPHELRKIPGIGFIAGNTFKAQLPDVLLKDTLPEQGTAFITDFKPGMGFDILPLKRFPDRSRAYLKIQDGCESFCTYCIVPFSRGPYRSLPIQDVLSLAENLVRTGCREIVLTGIHLGKYGVDLEGKTNLRRLLHAMGREGFPARIRLSSLEINEIGEDMIDMVAAESWLCRHFHIPLQSGDDAILKKMNRPYTAKVFIDRIETIAKRLPSAAIGLDVMAGFPGESRLAHENTCSLINDLPVSYLHVFPYSPRPGTAAADFEGQLGPGLIKNRAASLRMLGQKKRAHFYERCLGEVYQVLAEDWVSEAENLMKGTSDNYLPVHFPCDQNVKGQLRSIRMERVREGVVEGSAS